MKRRDRADPQDLSRWGAVGYQPSEQGAVAAAANYAKVLSAAQRSRRSASCWPPRRYSRLEVTGG